MTVTSLLTQTFCSPAWTPKKNLPDLSGKVALITGASAGLGKETAMQLAAKGAHVFCLGRSAEKTNKVIEEIKEITGNANVEFIQVDLLDLASVERAADAFLGRKLPLHICVLNAGIMKTPWGVSKNGIESQFATNHFAHVVLTMKLVPVLAMSQPSRIVVLSSIAHKFYLIGTSGGINYEILNDEKVYNPSTRYGETKLANLHFSNELQARLDAKFGPECKIFVNAVHPGVVNTELTQHYNQSFMKVASKILIDTAKGALTQIYVAGSEDIEKNNAKGRYFVPYGKEAATSSDAANKVLAIKTWEWTEEVLKKQYRNDWSYGI